MFDNLERWFDARHALAVFIINVKVFLTFTLAVAEVMLIHCLGITGGLRGSIAMRIAFTVVARKLSRSKVAISFGLFNVQSLAVLVWIPFVAQLGCFALFGGSIRLFLFSFIVRSDKLKGFCFAGHALVEFKIGSKVFLAFALFVAEVLHIHSLGITGGQLGLIANSFTWAVVARPWSRCHVAMSFGLFSVQILAVGVWIPLVSQLFCIAHLSESTLVVNKHNLLCSGRRDK